MTNSQWTLVEEMEQRQSSYEAQRAAGRKENPEEHRKSREIKNMSVLVTALKIPRNSKKETHLER